MHLPYGAVIIGRIHRKWFTSSRLDFKRRMHIIITIPFTKLLLNHHADAYLWLQHKGEKALTTDLQQLSLSYQHCHVHIVLFYTEVDIHGIHSPLTVTRLREKDSYRATIEFGGLAYPQMRHMIDYCQATFQVLPSKKHFNKLKKHYWWYSGNSL